MSSDEELKGNLAAEAFFRGWKAGLMRAHDAISRLTDGDSPAHDGAIVDAMQEIDKLYGKPNRVDPLHEAASDALKLLKTYVDGLGGCDHDVNICMCADVRIMEQLDNALKIGGLKP